MSQSAHEAKEEHHDVSGMDMGQSEKIEDTASRHEEEEKKGDFATFSSTASSLHEIEDRNHDLEAVTTVSTNSPPYSVFTKKQKYLIVCEYRQRKELVQPLYTNLHQFSLPGEASFLL